METKSFSKKFINHITSHPNTGFVFLGRGWSGKKQVLGIGIWATSNAEMIDISNNIRSLVPDAYNIVYQSELTRLEFFKNENGIRKSFILLDELENKIPLSPLELDYLKLLNTDGSLSEELQAKMLNITKVEISEVAKKLKAAGVCYELTENNQLPENYTKFFVDTSSLSMQKVNEFSEKLARDENCIYIARGNGKYNFEFEYVLSDSTKFNINYKTLLGKSKKIIFDDNLFTNLFPQSKFINIKKIQDSFVALAQKNTTYFDLRNSELWYVNHAGTNAYLNIYSNEKYKQHMSANETSLFREAIAKIERPNTAYNLVDLGSGNGQKGRLFIEEIGEKKIKSYFPVDIQEIELAQAIKTHELRPYSVHPTILNFSNLSTRFPLSKKSNEMNIYVLLGGTYGNFNSSLINSDLKSVLESHKDKLIVSMAIRDNVTDEEILDSYLNKNTEDISFSVLRQIGFSQSDFEMNKMDKAFTMNLRIDNNRLVTSYTLKKTKHILGLVLEPGTKFDILSSWKPTLEELKTALSNDFAIENVVSNKSFALVVCTKKI